MGASLEEFTRSLTECGLMTVDEVSSFVESLPPTERPGDGQQLAQAMVRRKKLTKFQAQAIYRNSEHRDTHVIKLPSLSLRDRRSWRQAGYLEFSCFGSARLVDCLWG